MQRDDAARRVRRRWHWRPGRESAGRRATPVERTIPATEQVDILFVVDDSDSIKDEQLRLASTVPALFDLLQREDGRHDLHVGVISTNMGAHPDIPGCREFESDDGVLQSAFTNDPALPQCSDGSLAIDGSFLRDAPAAGGGRATNYTGSLTGVLGAAGRRRHDRSALRRRLSDLDARGPGLYSRPIAGDGPRRPAAGDRRLPSFGDRERTLPMTMDGRVALVAGGAGTVGSGIVHAFLQAGATVIVPSRDPARIDALRAETGAPERVIGMLADVGSPEGAARVRAAVEREHGDRIDHVVASLGGEWRGKPLRELALEDFRAALHEYCGTHFVAMRALLPLIEEREGASYTIISGVAGEQLFDMAWGAMSVGAASLFGLSMVTRAEYADRPVRVNELRVGMRILRQHPVQGSPYEVSHRDVGKLAVGMARGKVRGEVIRVGDQTELRAACGRFGVL